MTINDSNTNKDFAGYGLSAKDVISVITIICDDVRRTEVDTINFEICCTDIIVAIVEEINHYLTNFKFSLVMEES